jgi:hypothetical protein
MASLPQFSKVPGIETGGSRDCGVRQGLTNVPSLWEEIAWGRFDQPPPETKCSIHSATRLPERVGDDWGRSESLDPDDVGDIADEGAGHRG